MGVTTKRTYDENGNVLTQTTPTTSSGTKLLQIVAYVYDDLHHPGDRTASIDPLGNETDYTYDPRGDLASVTDPLGNTWTYVGQPSPNRCTGPGVTITDPLGRTHKETCDENGNLLTSTDGNGATTTNTYDADNELTSSTDPSGRKTTYSYDADGQLTAVHMPDGSTSRSTYGADGELLTTVDPAGGITGFRYDGLGRTMSSKDQRGRTTTFAYDAVGNLTSTTDPMGVTATNTYDANRQLLKEEFKNGDIPTEDDFTYDLDGRRTSMTDDTGTTTYSYDALGQVTALGDGNGRISRKRYDLAGDVTSLQYPNGHTVTMQYDGNGQMTSVTDWLGNTTQIHYADDRYLLGLRVYDANKTYTAGDTAVYNTTLSRNAAGQIIHITAQDALGNAVASLDYTRAIDGRITSVQSTGLGDPHHAYDYDSNARLTSYDGAHVAFDSRNNVTTLPNGASLSYDGADQLTAMQTPGDSSTFTYDADGRRTSKSSAVGGPSYMWRDDGDLAAISDRSGTTTTYTTNGDGQRMTSSGGGVAHTFTWASGADLPTGAAARTPIAAIVVLPVAARMFNPKEYGVDKSVQWRSQLLSDGTHSFIYGPDGLPIEQIDNSDHALFLTEDAQGSVRLLADADGNVKGTASYDAFGNQTAQSGESSPLGFEGMYLDTESGLYAMSGSPYDPATGQTISQCSTYSLCYTVNGVSWSEQKAAACSSYQVCYTVDNGTTWIQQALRTSSASSPYAVSDPVNSFDVHYTAKAGKTGKAKQ
jgi:YD repeat-containing protein